MFSISPGICEITVVKIMIDMPLPTPRSVISSPSHMITQVPAVIVITIVPIVNTPWFGIRFLHVVVPLVPYRVPDLASATIAVDCRIARPQVRYRVYWVILAWPAWPSWRSVSSRGITTASSCRMMLAVMYGMMPSANTDSRYSAPPLNRLTSWNRLVLLLLTRLRHASTACSEIPGVGTEAPSRNMAMTKIVNSSFRRRSGVRNARMNAVSMPVPRVGASTSSTAPRYGWAPTGCWQRLPGRSLARSGQSDSHARGRAEGRAPALASPADRACPITSQLGDGPAGSGDLLPRRGGELVRGHPQPLRGRVAGAEHLHQLPGPDGALRGQVLGGHVPAVRVKGRQAVHVDHLVGGLEPQVGEPLELGQPARHRHLAALEIGRHGRPRLAALGAAASGLALGTLAAPDPGPRGMRARRRPQVVYLQPAPGRAAIAVCHVSRPPRRRPDGAPPGPCRVSPAGPP